MAIQPPPSPPSKILSARQVIDYINSPSYANDLDLQSQVDALTTLFSAVPQHTNSNAVPNVGSIGDRWTVPSVNYQERICLSAYAAGDLNKEDNWQDLHDAEAKTAADGALNAANSAIQMLYTPSVPTSASVGWIWIDTDDSNQPYRAIATYTSSYPTPLDRWEKFTDPEVQAAAAQAQSTADGKIEQFRQDAVPDDASVGDIWIDSDNNDSSFISVGSYAFDDTFNVAEFPNVTIYRESFWIPFNDSKARSLAAATRSIEDGKIVIQIASDSVSFPASAEVMDLYKDTGTNTYYQCSLSYSGLLDQPSILLKYWQDVSNDSQATSLLDFVDANHADDLLTVYVGDASPLQAVSDDWWVVPSMGNAILKCQDTYLSSDVHTDKFYVSLTAAGTNDDQTGTITATGGSGSGFVSSYQLSKLDISGTISDVFYVFVSSMSALGSGYGTLPTLTLGAGNGSETLTAVNFSTLEEFRRAKWGLYPTNEAVTRSGASTSGLNNFAYPLKDETASLFSGSADAILSTGDLALMGAKSDASNGIDYVEKLIRDAQAFSDGGRRVFFQDGVPDQTVEFAADSSVISIDVGDGWVQSTGEAYTCKLAYTGSGSLDNWQSTLDPASSAAAAAAQATADSKITRFFTEVADPTVVWPGPGSAAGQVPIADWASIGGAAKGDKWTNITNPGGVRTERTCIIGYSGYDSDLGGIANWADITTDDNLSTALNSKLPLAGGTMVGTIAHVSTQNFIGEDVDVNDGLFKQTLRTRVGGTDSVPGAISLNSDAVHLKHLNDSIDALVGTATTAGDTLGELESLVGTAQSTANTGVTNAATAQGTANNAVARSGDTMTGNLGGTTISMSGQISGASFQATSSRAKKTEIETFSASALNIITALNIVTFKYKGDDKGNPMVGFIADDVTDHRNELTGLGNDSMNYNSVMGILLKAVQELNEKVDGLRL